MSKRSVLVLPYSREVKVEDLFAHIHPADRGRVREVFTATQAIVGPYEIDFRIMVEDEMLDLATTRETLAPRLG